MSYHALALLNSARCHAFAGREHATPVTHYAIVKDLFGTLLLRSLEANSLLEALYSKQRALTNELSGLFIPSAVELMGIEPTTSGLQNRRSPS